MDKGRETCATATGDERNHGRLLVEALFDATVSFLKTGDVAAMAGLLLARYLRMSGAEYGLVFRSTDEGLKILSGFRSSSRASSAFSHDATLQRMDADGVVTVEEDSLLLAPIRHGRTVVSYEADSLKLQDLHLEIDSFLGTPLGTGDSVVGLVGIANRDHGFSEKEKGEIEAIAHTIALALGSVDAETDRLRAIESLRQSQKFDAIGQLAGGVAHDYNNLLTVIEGYAQLLLRFLEDDRLRRYAMQIDQASKRAAELTQQLLSFSRRQVMEAKVLGIPAFLAGLETMLRSLIPENISLDLVFGDVHANVVADAGLLEKVIVNLVLNARDAVEDAGSIAIEVRSVLLDDDFVRVNPGSQAGRYVSIAVKDNGRGMTEEVCVRAFEPFFSTKRGEKRAGLGLSTAYGIVKQSGGYITLDSVPGEGTVCTFYLPETALPEGAEADILRPELREKAAVGTILLVEDERALLDFVREVLESAGYTVHAEQDPRKALDFFSHAGDSVELLISDVVMPQLMGWELAEQLRARKRELGVLFISGYSDAYAKGRKFLAEGELLLKKPFTPEDLLAAVQGMLRKSGTAS